MIQARNNLICAIDTGDLQEALALAKLLKGHISALKLGLEFFTSCGSIGVRQIVDLGVPVFLDLKFHDIPNTVAGAVTEAVKLGVSMLTLHSSGGKDMLKRAVEAANITSEKYNIDKPLLLGVTVLTSLDASDIKEVGYEYDVKNTVLNLAGLAQESGLDGIVCSSYEISEVKKLYSNLQLIVPGIRFSGDVISDQKRVMSPSEAVSKGANYIVMGRPITNHKDPVERIKKYNLELSNSS